MNTYPQRSLLLAAEGVELTQRHGEGHLPVAEQALRDCLAAVGGRPLFDPAPRQYLPGPSWRVRFSPDGRILAAIGPLGVLRAWNVKDLPDGKPIVDAIIQSVGYERPDIAFDSTTNSVIVACLQWTLKYAGTKFEDGQQHSVVVYRYDIRPDGPTVSSTTFRRELQTVKTTDSGDPTIQLAPNGRFVAVREIHPPEPLADQGARPGRRSNLADLQFLGITNDGLQPCNEMPIPPVILGYECSFSPGGDWCIASAADASLHLVQLSEGKASVRQVIAPPAGLDQEILSQYTQRQTGYLLQAIFNLSDRQVWTNQAGIVGLWDWGAEPPFLKPVCTFPELEEVISVSPDGRWIFAKPASRDDLVLFRRTGQQLNPRGTFGVQPRFTAPLASYYCAFTSDSKKFYTYSAQDARSRDSKISGGLQVHDLSEDAPVIEREAKLGNEGRPRGLYLSPCNEWLASVDGSNVRIWKSDAAVDRQEPQTLWTFRRNSIGTFKVKADMILAQQFMFVRPSEPVDGTWAGWKLNPGQQTFRPFPAERKLAEEKSGMLSDDGQWLVTNGAGEELRLWDLKDEETDRPESTVTLPSRFTRWFWANGNRRIGVVSIDGRVIVYRVTDEKELELEVSTAIAGWHAQDVVHQSHDGRWLSFGTVADGAIAVEQFDLDAKNPLAESSRQILPGTDETSSTIQNGRLTPRSGVSFSSTGRWAIQRFILPDEDQWTRVLYDVRPGDGKRLSALFRGLDPTGGRVVLNQFTFDSTDHRIAFVSGDNRLVVGTMDDLNNADRWETLGVTIRQRGTFGVLSGQFVDNGQTAAFCFRNEALEKIHILRLSERMSERMSEEAVVTLPHSAINNPNSDALELLPNGKLLMGLGSSDGDSRLMVWRVDVSDLVALAKKVAGRTLDSEERGAFHLEDATPVAAPGATESGWSIEALTEAHEASLRGESDGAPAKAVAPFDSDHARRLQESWAEHLNSPVEYTNSIDMKLRLIPPGEFDMGGEDYHVRLTRPFYAGVYEVTVGQFRQFVAETGHKTVAESTRQGGFVKLPNGEVIRKPEHIWKQSDFAASEDHPVALASWTSMYQFCEWLTKREKRIYRLPTEAEWEWAARAGSSGRFFFGNDVGKFEEFAWSSNNSGRQSHSVGVLQPNPWGLFDVYGNLFEVCSDAFRDWPLGTMAVNPRGGFSGSLKVLRGGSYIGGPESQRASLDAQNAFAEVGFRVIMSGDLRDIPATAPTTTDP